MLNKIKKIFALVILGIYMISCSGSKKNIFEYRYKQKSKIRLGDTLLVFKSNSGLDTIWNVLKTDSCLVKMDTMLYSVGFDIENNVADFNPVAAETYTPTEVCFGGRVLNTKNDIFYMELKLVYLDSVKGYLYPETRIFFCRKTEIDPRLNYIGKDYISDDMNEFIKLCRGTSKR